MGLFVLAGFLLIGCGAGSNTPAAKFELATDITGAGRDFCLTDRTGRLMSFADFSVSLGGAINALVHNIRILLGEAR